MKKRCPMAATDLIDRYFLENRARLLEVAAFLDRVDRCDDAETGRADYRYQALCQALRLLCERETDRTLGVHECMSDPTTEPLESAAGLAGASGAWPGAYR